MNLRLCICLAACLARQAMAVTPDEPPNPLALPAPGTSALRILSPTLLELSLVSSKAPDPAPLAQWDFVDSQFQFHPPGNSDFVVRVAQRTMTVKAIGFKRRPLYAPLKKRDLRIGSWLYLILAQPLNDGEEVEIKNPTGKLWGTNQQFIAKADPLRWSPVIHVNQEGYLPNFPKKAMIGYYLGSLGEMSLATKPGFRLIDGVSGKTVFEGPLTPRTDTGYEFVPRPYQQVLEADFSDFKTPGLYRLLVPELGASIAFRIDEGIAADWARTYALGLYHQRCGTSNALPYTRFVHPACHLRSAQVPDTNFAAVNAELAAMSSDWSSNPRHTAPQLKSVDASLYPFINTNQVDVSGGHHDAGDYSKYTINSAHPIHALVFAVDAFPGVGELDNLGLPESGDGKSDILQEAKWEADFLAKLQDADGGFYFLVYPRDREYEHDVSLTGSDVGDQQVVFPKTTAATAAAVAALAQIGSSPLFKKQFPEAAGLYLEKAKQGWAFLQRAIARHGRDGSYQKITHYGDEFMHDDELVWAAAELFAATGDRNYENEVISHFNPADPNTRRWTWWRLFESYGNAVRCYAFAARSGRLKTNQLDARFLEKCEDEIIAAGNDQLAWARANAYGTSFPEQSKRFRNAGWYFSLDRAFDLAVACQINYPSLRDPRPRFIEAILSNLNYEGGCNPLNIVWVAGLGSVRQREIVHQFAQNQRRVLPPTGLAFGNIQEGFAFLEAYKKELGTLTFPPDWDSKNPYPFYDRWGDSFNTATEFVTVNLARSVAAAAFLMARTSIKDQPWKGAEGRIEITAKNGNCAACLHAADLDLKTARCVWEMDAAQPLILPATNSISFAAALPGWVEAEAWLPDGRRVFASTNLVIKK